MSFEFHIIRFSLKLRLVKINNRDGLELTLRLCRELTQNSQLVRNKNRENTRQRKKIITCTRQYLHGSAIYLHSQSCRDFTIIREKNTSGAV